MYSVILPHTYLAQHYLPRSTASGCLHKSHLDEVQGDTHGQYHKFVYVQHGGISSYLTTKLIALLSPNPLLDIITMASAAAATWKAEQERWPTLPHRSTTYYPTVTADAKEVVRRSPAPPIKLHTHIMCSHRQLLWCWVSIAPPMHPMALLQMPFRSPGPLVRPYTNVWAASRSQGSLASIFLQPLKLVNNK